MVFMGTVSSPDQAPDVYASNLEGLPTMAAAGRSLVIILIMKPHPFHDFLFIAALRREVEVVVSPDQHIQASGISGISVENLARFIAIKHAEAGEFFFGAVGFFVVVGGFTGGDVFCSGRDAEVVIEIAAF